MLNISTSLPSTICPITLIEMEDPVLAQDGHTYERSAIETWIRSHGISPNTRQVLSIHGLVPNRALKEMIDLRRQELGYVAPHQPPTGQNNTMRGSYSALFSTVQSATTAEYHINSMNKDETIVRIQLPKSSMIARKDFASAHICCVIDISASMAAEAICHDPCGLERHTGLSILDVVKYAAEVIAQSLSRHDFLSIVTYSNDAKVVLRPTQMTTHGKKIVSKQLATIKAEFRTNLWAGIKQALKMCAEVSENSQKDSISNIFVLTDGLPNMDPPLGYDRAIKSELERSPLFGSLSTFGFGSDLDSPLLARLAKLGRGTFSFIPESGMVGTVFINALANARCAFGVNPMLKIKGGSSSTNGELYCTTTSDSTCIHLTPLRYDTSLDIVLPNDMVGEKEWLMLHLDIELIFEVVGGREVHVAVKAATSQTPEQHVDVFNSTRMSLVQTIPKVTRSKTYSSSIKDSFQLSSDAENLRAVNIPLDDLCKDIEDQATMAISREDYYERWGRHYLLSLRDAHLNQICNNFKDPGVQVYGGGEKFKKLQEDLNDIFDSIKPPKPKRKRGEPKTSTRRASMAAQFNNPDAICVHGDTLLQVRVDGAVQSVPISQVKRGDSVLTESGAFVKVDCIVQTSTDDSQSFSLVRLGELLVTPYHPVNVGSTWRFPIDCLNAEIIDTDATSVYNLVLDDRSQGVLMGGICCSTLGHGLTDNDTIRHEYFGTEKVIRDLQQIESYWETGHVVIRPSQIERCGNGEICRIGISDRFDETVSFGIVSSC